MQRKEPKKHCTTSDPKLNAKCVVNLARCKIDPKFFKSCFVILPRLNLIQQTTTSAEIVKSDSDIFESDSMDESNLISNENNKEESCIQNDVSDEVVQLDNVVEVEPEDTAKSDLSAKSEALNRSVEVICISSDEEDEPSSSAKSVQFEFVKPQNIPKVKANWLKPGKQWRRSLSLLRASVSVLDVTGDFCCKGKGYFYLKKREILLNSTLFLGHPCKCNHCKNERKSLRMSVRIIPDEVLRVKTEPTDFTPLEQFAIFSNCKYTYRP